VFQTKPGAVLISGPAGAGKTTLVTRFAADTGLTDGQKLREQFKILQEYMQDQRAFRKTTLSLADLADAVGMSQRAATRAINYCLGQNFHTFVNSYRVEAVKQALAGGAHKDKTILEIAYSQGFSSKSTFNDVFKKMVGTTPSEFRDGLGK
jgi:AraC-like DNA-binding protein